MHGLHRTGREAMLPPFLKSTALRLTTSLRKSCCPHSAKPDFIPFVHRTRAFGFSVPPAHCAAPALLNPFSNNGLSPARVLCTLYYLHNPFTVLSSLKTGFILTPGHPFFPSSHRSSCPRDSAHQTTTLHELDAKENPATSSNVRGMATNSLTFW